MFTEVDTIEAMILKTLQCNGWKYISAEQLQRKYSDAYVESMIKDALIRLNPVIAEDESKADEVIFKLRALFLSTDPQNLVTQNEAFKQFVFEKNSYPFGKDGRQVAIDFFGTELNGKLDKNECVVTNQWVYPRKKGGKRLDIVLLINGFPVAIGEVKTPTRSSITWLDGAQDINNYERSIPAMFVANFFNFATEGKFYRYGAVCMPAAKWGPWHTTDDKLDGNLSAVKGSVQNMITPEKTLDLFQFFTLFTTDSKYKKTKIIARYQQYEGANMIVKRVKEGCPNKGLIWHFQGSGKAYLMEFAAVKLRMLPALKNPTVIVVDDRLDLESQITAQFHSSDVANLESAGTIEQLMSVLRQDIRKIIITTIYRFQDVTEELSPRENIIVLVDECHRTQEGDLGRKMRTALPNAFFFGLTGTPINRIERNTFATFGAAEDPSGYMSRYSFSDSIRDHATLPLKFEPVPVDLHVDKETMDREFDVLTKDLSDKQRAVLEKHVNIKAIMYNQKRIHKVCAHIANHFLTKVHPNGYKALIVVLDRPCCIKYKNELDKLLEPERSTIVMDTNDDKANEYKAYARTRDEESKILERFRNPDDKLEIIIVCNKLLTGFDAPILQCMYLDKPIKDHTLLQAICRTNRTYDEGKTCGLVVDYIGIFDDVAKALDFDESSMRKVITNIDEIRKQIPDLLKKCLSYFVGVDRSLPGWQGLIVAQDCLPTNDKRDQFGADYIVLNRAWNMLSPDPELNAWQTDYTWLTKVYESIKPTDGSGRLIWAALGQKTLEIIDNNLDVRDVHKDEEILTLDANQIDECIKKYKDAKTASKIAEIALVAKIRKHTNDPKYIKLGDKLEQLREKHAQGLIDSTEFLKRLLVLAKEVAEAEKKVVPEAEIDKGKAALTELFNGIKNKKTPVIVESIVSDIDKIVKNVRFDGWQKTIAGSKEVKKVLRNIVWVKYKIKDQDVFDKAYNYIKQYY